MELSSNAQLFVPPATGVVSPIVTRTTVNYCASGLLQTMIVIIKSQVEGTGDI